MPRDATQGEAKAKPAMIREVLEGDLDLPTAKVQAAVWERYGGEVTAAEIARERSKLRQPARSGAASPPAEPPMRKPQSRMRAEKAKSAAGRQREANGPIRAKDFVAGEATVKQLAAILEVAEQVGGLRRLREALATAALVREKVGDVDELQLKCALDFLARLTGRK